MKNFDSEPDNIKVYQDSFPFALVESAKVREPLFRTVKRGERDGFEILRENDKGSVLRFAGPKELDQGDADVYFTILAMAGRFGYQEGRREVIDKEAPKLWDDLEAKSNARNEETYSIRTTMYEVLKTLGYGSIGSSDYKWLRKSLVRLSDVSIRIFDREEKMHWGMNMLSFAEALDEDEVPLSIAIDSRSMDVISGELPYRKINIDERKGLESPITKKVHEWVSGWKNEGDKGRIKIDNLARNVWHDFDEKASSTQRSLRSKLKDALSELDSLESWGVEEPGKGGGAIVEIIRYSHE